MGSVLVREGAASEESKVCGDNRSVKLEDAFNEWWEHPVLGARKDEACRFAPPIVFASSCAEEKSRAIKREGGREAGMLLSGKQLWLRLHSGVSDL